MITMVGRGGACSTERGGRDLGEQRDKRERTYKRDKERGQSSEGWPSTGVLGSS